MIVVVAIVALIVATDVIVASAASVSAGLFAHPRVCLVARLADS